uniref:Kinetochore associated 1 n=1 Tax=Echeneis naucrates TaxID=173247 RepID=A0A665X5B7_ECHNA
FTLNPLDPRSERRCFKYQLLSLLNCNDVELLTNEDTNTVRLGSVSREENGSGLYQVDTLVKISTGSEVQTDPRLSACSGSNCSIVVADKTVILFDQSYQTVLLLLHFETDVDAIDVCLEGQFLVVCERNGNLHLIYVPHKRILLTRVFSFSPIYPAVLTLITYVSSIYIIDIYDMFSLCRLWLRNPQVEIRKHFCSTKDYHDEGCNTAVMFNQGQEIHFMIGVSLREVLFIYLQPEIMIHWLHINSLQIRFLPSMIVCFSLDVSSVSCLVQTKINMDTIYLVEGTGQNQESGQREPVSSVIVRCFTEALPENRLSRLLHKHMFEEAEKFAIAFELDLELVYKVKLGFVLEQLASASVGGYGQDVWSELVDEAKTNLMKITDEQYVVEYCLKAPWPTFDTAEKMLNHAATRYSTLQIQEALARLATFCSLHGLENFNGIAWIEFLNSTDNLGDILTHLRDGDINGAKLLWLRYEGQIAVDFDETKLEAVLSAIPEDLPSQDLCPWFKTVIVPFVRKVLPSALKILARWLDQRARNLELTEKSGWPKNGLDLAVLGLPSDNGYGAAEVENLKSLVSNLRQLLDLHHKYNCRLSLSVFEKGNVRSVAFFMLDKVPAPELIAATVENSILPYTEEHNIPFDELLLQYIKNLLERCSSQTTTLFTEWEAKAVAVLGCMKDTDLKVDAVLEIMQKAVVPWSNLVEKLVQQYLEMDGPKQELLKESYHLMEIRKLLRGYGIRNFNLSNSTEIMVLIRYILKQDLQMSLEDSLTLARAYKLPTSEINYLYLIQLIDQGKTEECMTILKGLSPAEAECVVERLTSWARLQLEDKVHISDEVRRSRWHMLKINLECENNLVMFKAIAHLQEDFDIFFTPSNYEDPNIRKQIQEHHITAYENTRGRHSSKGKPLTTPVVANDPDGKTKTISTEAGLRRLGRQLQRSEQELWSDLALRALSVGKVDKALKILSELYEHHYNTSTGKVLFTAAKTLCQMLEADVPMVLPRNMDLPAVIHDLACQAITVCHSDLLLDCLELCKCTRIAMDVYHQCQLSDNYGFVSKVSILSFCIESHLDIFKEDCIVLDPVSVLPVQYEITKCLLPVSQETKLYPLDCSCLSHCSFEDGSNYLQLLLDPLANMLQMLQECSQLELALRVLVNSYGSCLQHVTSNVMDIKLSVQVWMLRYNICLNDLRKTTTSSVNAVAVALLNKVFNWRVVDHDFAIGLCTLLAKADVFRILWKVIDNTWQNYDKILAVARIGANLSCLYNEPEEQENFLSVITDAEWGIRLGELEISIQPVFRQRPEMKRSLIPVLVKNRKITPDIILEYCSTFGLDHDNVINQYITTLLLLQEDEKDADDLGAGQEEVKPLCHADALERVLQIIPMLHSTSELTGSLCAALFKLSPYNYERIEVVLKIIQAADENVTHFSISQAMGLLQHLKSYKRVSAPSDVESTYLLENSLLPNALSSSRLPFHLLLQTKHFWKVICPELSEETFPTLLLISKLMKVSLDKLYMSAANHVFEKKMKPLILEQRKKGQGHSYNKETFKVAKTMTKYILCIQSSEWAAATAHKLTQELPPGYEKTQSLRFCLSLGDAWLNNPNLEEAARAKGETFLSKLKLQFQRSATENTLIASQLNSPEHLKLTGLPARLIVALYEHSSVEQRYRDSGGQTYPDIHSAIKEIATVNNVDLLKIRNMMLEKWICKTGPAMAKVCHVCLMSVVFFVFFVLFCFFLGGGGALLCLVCLTDADTLEAQLQICRTKIQYYLKCHIFVSQLEALNIPYTVQSFLSSPKEGLVKGLWKNHSHEPQAVRLVADLCLEYQVYDPQLWNSLLQKLLGFSLISHLQKVLEAAVAVPALWEVLHIFYIWSYYLFFPRCPFLLNLDLIGIANRFAQFSLPAFALGTLLLIPCANKKAQQIQGFLSVCNPVNVLEQVEELMNTGELAGIPSQIRETVLTFISQNGQHQKLLKTKHFKYLKQMMVSRGQPNQVKNLVDYLISQNCQDDADSLISDYMKHRGHERGKALTNGCLKVTEADILDPVQSGKNHREIPTIKN